LANRFYRTGFATAAPTFNYDRDTLAPEDACSVEMLVLVRSHGRVMAVPLSQLAAIDSDESTAGAIGDWHYWVARGYLF